MPCFFNFEIGAELRKAFYILFPQDKILVLHFIACGYHAHGV